jgi:Holliday junction DNA helicase RuvA
MIARLRGRILESLPNRLVIDVNGVGYLVSIPLSTYDKLNPQPGDKVDIHTHMHVWETAHTLYGFASDEEKELFLLLIDRVSGIGPAIAMGVLSGMPVDHFKACVVNNEVAALSKIKGLGKKGVERIILELKDKIGITDAWKNASAEGVSSAISDTELALISLGYKQVEARKAVKAAADVDKDADTDELLRAALRMLNS